MTGTESRPPRTWHVFATYLAAVAAILVTTSLGTGGVLLTVRDNGTGIAEGVMGRIFEPYVTTKPKGTGLGLAIVKKIVDEHQGRILVENVKPHGANVSIVFPPKAA